MQHFPLLIIILILICSPIVKYFLIGTGTNSCIFCIVGFYSEYYYFGRIIVIHKVSNFKLFFFRLLCECPRFFFAIQNEYGCVCSFFTTFLLVFFSLFVISVRFCIGAAKLYITSVWIYWHIDFSICLILISSSLKSLKRLAH